MKIDQPDEMWYSVILNGICPKLHLYSADYSSKALFNLNTDPHVC